MANIDQRRVVEGKLYAWAQWRAAARPAATVSAIYADQVGRTETPDRTSAQERWAVSHAVAIAEAGVIEATLQRCSKDQRELVVRRYGEGRTWQDVAAMLYVGERTAFRIRDEVLAILAVALGLWGEVA